MARTLLQIIQAVQQELGLPQAVTVIGNSDATTSQMFAFANLEIEKLWRAKDEGWTVLQKQFNIAVNVPTTLVGDVLVNTATIKNISPNTSALTADLFTFTGTGIPVAARILSVDSASQITMDMIATATQAAASLVFAQDSYALPSDFGFYQMRSWWDRTNHWELLGPDSPQLDQWHKSGIIATGPRRHFRQRGSGSNRWRLWPPPAEIVAPLQAVFEYISNQPIFVNAGATTASLFANDADTSMLDDRAIVMGIKWRFWQQKGFNWTSLRTEYDNFVDFLIGKDGGKQTLNLVNRIHPIFLSPANAQDGFFPGPTGPNMG